MRIGFLAFVLTIATQTAVAADSANVRVKGAWPYSIARGVFVEGDIAYVGVGGGLWIMDVSDPAAPRRIGVSPGSGRAYNPTKVGNLLFTCHRQEGLFITDVTDPEQPVTIGRLLEDGDVITVAVVDTLAYLGCNLELRIVNVSDPSRPFRIASFPLSALSGYGLAVQDSLLYVTDGFGGLRILSIADPKRLRQVGVFTPGGGIFCVTVAESLAYAAGDTTLYILNVADPTAPILVSELKYKRQAEADNFEDLQLQDTLVFAACALAGLRVYNVADPAHPHSVGATQFWGWSVGLAISGTTVHVAAEYAGLVLLDAADPGQPVVQGSYLVPSWILSLALRGDRTFLSTPSGLWVLDISDPTRPTDPGSRWRLGSSSAVISADTLVYVHLWDSLHVINVASDSLTILGSCYLGSAKAFCLMDSFLLAARCGPSHIAGLAVFNIADPTAPREVGAWYGGHNSYPQGVSTFGHYAVLGDGNYHPGGRDGGFRIFDLSEPRRPVQVSRFAPGFGSAAGSYVRDGIAYLCAGQHMEGPIGGLVVADFSSPIAPRLIRKHEEYTPTDIAVSGNLGVLANLYRGLAVVDLEDPENVKELGHYNIPRGGIGMDVTIADGLVHLAHDYGGYLILEYYGPSPGIADSSRGATLESARLTVLPSPATDRVGVEFAVPVRCSVRVSLYDALGRALAVLYHGQVDRGQSRLDFSTDELPAGTYFVSLEANGDRQRSSFTITR
ncbi:MAG: hypothetical protein R6X14_03445 [bacterium]